MSKFSSYSVQLVEHNNAENLANRIEHPPSKQCVFLMHAKRCHNILICAPFDALLLLSSMLQNKLFYTAILFDVQIAVFEDYLYNRYTIPCYAFLKYMCSA